MELSSFKDINRSTKYLWSEASQQEYTNNHFNALKSLNHIDNLFLVLINFMFVFLLQILIDLGLRSKLHLEGGT